MLRFFLNAYVDARRDPFFPCGRFAAVWFVVSNWRWLRSPTGPYFGAGANAAYHCPPSNEHR